jgi:hypothetical protein
MGSVRAITTGFIFLCAISGGFGSIIINGPVSGWQPVWPADPTRQADYFIDTQANAGDLDIVGGVGINPGFMVQFWNGGDDTSRTDGQIAFRLRMSGDSSPSGFSVTAFVGMDLTQDGVLDLFVTGRDASGSADITIRDAGTGANNSPSTSTISNTNTFSYATSATNFSWMPVTGSNDPEASSLDIDNNNGTDYFVSFLVPFADLVSAASSLGIDSSFDDTKSLAYVAMTSTNPNNLTGDFHGLTKDEAGSTQTFRDLGGISPELSADGTPIPEPATFVVAFGLVALAFGIHRRRTAIL